MIQNKNAIGHSMSYQEFYYINWNALSSKYDVMGNIILHALLYNKFMKLFNYISNIKILSTWNTGPTCVIHGFFIHGFDSTWYAHCRSVIKTAKAGSFAFLTTVCISTTLRNSAF